MAGLRVGQAYGGVPPTWVWVVGVSPQNLEHPTSICDTGVNWPKHEGRPNEITALLCRRHKLSPWRLLES